MPSLNTKLASAPNTQTNYVLKATSSTTIGNSIIQDNGTTATVGGALTATGQVEGTIINSTSNAFRLSGNNALSLVTLNSQSVVKINAAGFWGTQIVGANDSGILVGNTGNVLIGTTTDLGLSSGGVLQVNSPFGMSITNGGQALRFIRSGVNTFQIGQGSVTSQTGLIIADVTAATNPFFLQQGTGNIGISTTNPQMKLEASGSLGLYQNTTGSNGAQIYLGDTNFQGGAYATSAPGIGAIFSSGSGVAGDLAFYVYTGSMNSRTERMRILSGGGVGIGNTGASDVRLFVKSAGAGAGTYNIYSRDSNNVDLFVIRDDGYGYLKANAWAYGSDRRIKENISYIQTGLDKVLALKPAKFDYIDGVKNNIGWIAQDVQEVIPEAVNTISEDNDQLTLKSDFIIPYLVKAIQEQQAQIEELKALINK